MAETLVVQTNSGPVRGIRREGSAGQRYYTFFGIPYAKAPVGELRFKAPQPADAWTEERDATEPAVPAYVNSMPFMPELDHSKNPSSEDCLYVNVYRPVASATAPRPVMVMLHGGGFVTGSSNEAMCNPEFLLEHDIVYVSVNYRLGPLGFLSVADERYDIPGNAGLKDQALALRWVRANIAHFGGDAANVTIMGISAGGASVHCHLISPHSRGLFDRAICQSGSVLNSWANRPQRSELNERLARALGWTGAGGEEAMVRTILDAPAAALAKHAQSALSAWDHQNGMLFAFVPTVEPYDNGTVFLGRDLRTMNREAWSHGIPIMVGGTSDEGYMMEADYRKRADLFAGDEYFDNALPRELGLPVGGAERRRLGERLKRFYYGDEKPSVENFKPYVDLLTEKQFWHGIYATVKARLARADAAGPTYLYNFAYSSETLVMLQMMMCGRHVDGAVHGEDMLYQFKLAGVNDALPVESAERQLRVTYNTLCTSFAATGKPTSAATAELNWEPVSGTAPFRCLNITDQPSIVELPNTKRLQFWDSLCDY